MQKVWTVYKVRNQINGRLYIGVHKTADPEDAYMGSGKWINRAIKKHGRENFRKTVLLVTEDKVEAFNLERSLVTADRIEAGELYNLKLGGEGGWDHVNAVDQTERNRKVASLRNYQDPVYLKKHSLAVKVGQSKIIQIRVGNKGFTGKKHTKESKKKMSLTRQAQSQGSQNSQFGTMWITDGNTSGKIKKDQPIPDGWSRGRKLK